MGLAEYETGKGKVEGCKYGDLFVVGSPGTELDRVLYPADFDDEGNKLRQKILHVVVENASADSKN